MPSKYSKKDYFQLLEEFKMLSVDKPKKAQKEAYYSLKRMGKVEIKGKEGLIEKLPLLILLVIIIINIVSSLLNSNSLIMAIFGFFFFFPGYTIIMQSEEPAGIIFLFTHGFLGFCIMNAFSFSKVYLNANGALSQDIVYIGAALALALVIGSLIYGVLYLLSENMRVNPLNKSKPILLAAASTIMIQVLAILANV